MKILISGGGTGGHLIPGISLYNEMKKRGHVCRYVLRDTDLRYDTVKYLEKKDRLLVHITGISRKLSWKTPIYLVKLLGVFLKLFRYIRRFHPDVVLTTGGYVSNPAALTARFLRIPLYIAEQNSVAGITNRFYSKYARAVMTAFPHPEKLRCPNVIHTGNPILFTKALPRVEALARLKTEKSKTIVGVSGGSQGAGVINDTIFELLPEFDKRGIGLLWSLGAVEYKRFEKDGGLEKINRDFPHVRAFRYINDMGAFYSAVDVIISRAGATSIAEYIHWSIPALLIPIYHSPDEHQLKNAQYLEENHAALILNEPEINKDKVIEMLSQLFNEREEFARAYAPLKTPDAAQKIADYIEKQEGYSLPQF